MPRYGKFAALALAASLVCGLASSGQADPPGVPAGDVDDRPQPLAPRHERSETEHDRITAAALYTHGRTLLQRDDVPGALRRFQRAWRYHAQPKSLIKEIIALAAELDREEEAARYALIAARENAADEPLLRRMGLYLSEQRDFRGAIELYEKSLVLHRDPKPDLGLVLLHMELGRLYFLLEEFPAAARHLKLVAAALAKPSDHGLTEEQARLLRGKPEATYTLLGEAFLQAGEYAAAGEAFAKVEAAAPHAALHAFHQARLLAAENKGEAALAQLEKSLAAEGPAAGTEPYELLAKLLREKHAPDGERATAELVSQLEAWQAAQPKNAPLALFLASHYRQAKQFPRAVALLEAQRRANPSAEALQELAGVYLDLKNFPELLGVLGELALGENGIESAADEVKLLVSQPESLDRFLLAAQARVEESSRGKAPGELFAAGLVALEAQRFDVADELLGQAAAAPKPGKPQVLLAWGLGLFIADEAERAARVFSRAVNEKALPRNPAHLHYLLAAALEFAGHTDEALAAADEAARLQPNAPLYPARKGWVLYHAKRYAEAERAYLSLLERFDHEYRLPELRQEMREARLVLSHLCVLQNRPQEAEEWLEQVLDEFPGDISAQNDLSFLWSERGQHLQRSLVMAQAAVAAEPNNEAYRDSLGWVLFRLGRHQEAAEQLHKAASDGADGVILDHLGDALHAAGKAAEARAAWQRALEAFRKQNEAEKIKAVEKKLSAG